MNLNIKKGLLSHKDDLVIINKMMKIKEESNETQNIQVTINGLKKKKVINEYENVILSRKIKLMFQKTKCIDYFQFS